MIIQFTLFLLKPCIALWEGITTPSVIQSERLVIAKSDKVEKVSCMLQERFYNVVFMGQETLEHRAAFFLLKIYFLFILSIV